MICVNWCRIIIILLWSLCWFSLLQNWTLDGARLLKQKVCVWEEKIIASYQSVCYLYFTQANMLHHLNLHYCFQIWKTKMSVPWIIILTLARTSLFSQLFSLIFSPFYWFLIAFVCLTILNASVSPLGFHHSNPCWLSPLCDFLTENCVCGYSRYCQFVPTLTSPSCGFRLSARRKPQSARCRSLYWLNYGWSSINLKKELEKE